jgi:hypothetical protein
MLLNQLLAALLLYGALFGDARVLWVVLGVWIASMTVKPGARCFSEDSRVMISSGRVIPIADVRTGMRVVSSFGRTVHRVVSTTRHDAANVVLMSIHTADQRTITVTPDHYIVTSRGFVCAGDVREGVDSLRRMDGAWVGVTAVERIFTHAPTYNIWLEGTPYVCVNGLVATPCCRVSPLVELANDTGFLKAAATIYSHAVASW